MTIDNIKGNSYTPKKSNKSDSSQKANRPDATNGLSKSSSDNKAKNATNLSLSGSTFKNELAFTKKVLGNAQQESFASLKKIKQKINSGAYNTEDVHKKISTLITSDLGKLQDVLAQPAAKESASTLTAERKKNLLENPEVTKKIADNIVGDWEKL